MRAILTFLFLCLAAPLLADPGDPWEGTFRDVNYKTMWLFQDGREVWGESTRPIAFEGRVSPNGRVLRGTWFRKNHAQGLFEFHLSDDGQSYAGDGTAHTAPAGTFPDARGVDDWGGDRRPTELVRPGFAEDTGRGLRAGYNPQDPAHVAWLNFEDGTGTTPFREPAPVADPEPGDLGLWDVYYGGGIIGVVGMNATDDGFSASGPAIGLPLPGFDVGAEMTLTITDTATFGMDRIAASQRTTRHDDRAAIREVDGDAYRVDVAAGLLPDGASTMLLSFRPGSRPAGGTVSPNPPELPQTATDLRPDLPGNLGFWTLRLNGEAVGAVALNQNPGNFEAKGRMRMPGFVSGRVARINLVWDSLGDLTLRRNDNLFTAKVAVREMEGDQFAVTIPDGINGSGDVTLFLTLDQGTLPGRGGAATRPTDLRFVDGSFGMSIDLRDGPQRNARIVSRLPATTTGITLRSCDPRLGPNQLALTGQDFTDTLSDRFCLISHPDGEGWAWGPLLTR